MGIPNSFSPSVAASTPFSPPFPSSAQGQWVGVTQALMDQGFGCALRASGQRQPHLVCAKARKSLRSPGCFRRNQPNFGIFRGMLHATGAGSGRQRTCCSFLSAFSRNLSCAAASSALLAIPPSEKNGLEARNFSKQREKSTPPQLLPTFRSVDSRGGDRREMGV